MDPPELREDLKQEVFTIVCEMEEQKLMQLFGSGNIRFFIVRIIINQIQSVNSPFYKKYRKVRFHQLVEAGSDRSERHVERFELDQTHKFNLKGFRLEYPTDHPIETINEITKEENILNQCEQAVSNLYWYDQEILRLYAHHGNIRAVSKATGIPFTSVHHTIKKARQAIKSTLVYD